MNPKWPQTPGGDPDSPLTGLKVVELARILAGPWVGQTLADLGADVIKIEAPLGDDTRSWGPPFVGDTAAYFYAANRGKDTRRCDLTNADDLGALKSLIAEADVLIENFKVGGLAKYGLDYASLAPTCPRLIYTSITGFGQTGPYASRAGYDFLIQGMSGIMDITGDPDGPPTKMGVAFADIFTGLYGVIGVQAALVARNTTGKGQHIDLSLFDCMLGVLANQAQNAVSGKPPTRLGNAHPNIVPYGVFPTADGHVIIAAGNDRQFKDLCGVLGIPDFATLPQVQTNANRVENRETLIATLDARTRGWTRDALLSSLAEATIPAGPILTVTEALEHPQTRAREMVTKIKGHPYLRSPLTFSNSRLTLKLPAPSRPD